MTHKQLKARLDKWVAETTALTDLTNPAKPGPSALGGSYTSGESVRGLYRHLEGVRKSISTVDFNTYLDRLTNPLTKES